MELRLGFIMSLVFCSVIVGLETFSLSFTTGREAMEAALGFRGRIGETWGMKFEILLSGNLTFEGPSGGFFTVVVFCVACFRDD